MIYSILDSDNIAFEELLGKTREYALSYLDVSTINSGNKFEKFVFECMLVCAKGTAFDNKLYQTADREFPDIVVNQYWGVEVKFTKDDKWESIGNSVLESSRVDSVQKIYIFFGKCGGTPDIKYRKYEDCLYGISVTHYPRYKIDMNLEKGQSIFDLMRISYDELRLQEQPVRQIKKYYKSILKDNNSLWWIDDDISSNKTFEIIDFANLSLEQKSMLVAEGFILYPEVLNSQYARLCAFWVSYYSIICPNMRDQYSAGGQKSILAEPNSYKGKLTEKEKRMFKRIGVDEISQLHYRFLFKYVEQIKYLLEHIDIALVSECWGIEITNDAQLLEQWKTQIDRFTPNDFPINLSEAFHLMLNEYCSE